MVTVIVVRPGTALWRRSAALRRGRAAVRRRMPEALAREVGVSAGAVGLAALVSQYIGETEKNLARMLESTSAREWVLLFDEADALFGKRTNVRDAHDRFANQEVAHVRMTAADAAAAIARLPRT